jgi:MoxR-like ATPase
MTATKSRTATSTVADALNQFRNGVTAIAEPPPAPAEPEPEPVPGERIGYPLPNGNTYYARRLKKYTDVEILRANRGKTLRENLFTLLWGNPGTGKSNLPLAAFGEELIVFEGDGDTTVDDLQGGWVQMPDGSYLFVDGPLTVAAEQGRPLFIDEVAQISPKVMASVYAAMDGRGSFSVKGNPKRDRVVVKDGFFVVGACNPNAPGAKMSEALTSRFLVHVEATTDYDLARDLGVPGKLVTAAKNLKARQEEGTVDWAPEMRELLAFRDTMLRTDTEFALSNLVGVAPEDSRPIVADTLSRAFAMAVVPLRMGPAATVGAR